jgi:2-polyprenyl-3-methyl-5-hydroxy-6-metoxy-1,4-benzoquinol methylase
MTGFFDERAGSYRDWTRTSPAFHERRNVFLTVARQAMHGRDPLCLDLGCGTGAISIALAGLGYRVRGVDTSPAMLAEAETAADASDVGDRCSFVLQDVSQFLGEFDEPADLVVCSSLLEYLSEPLAVARLASQRLGRPGTIAMSIPNEFSLLRRFERFLFRRGWASGYRQHWPGRLDLGELLGTLEEEGLKIEMVRSFGLPTRWVPRLEVVSNLEGSKWLGTLTLAVARRA